MDASTLPIVPTGLGGIVTLIILMILSGKLIPKSASDKRVEEMEKRVLEIKEDRDMWKEAYLNASRTNSSLVSQVDVLMEVGRTTDRVMRSLPSALEESEESPDDEISA
jgi:hypothetical protein